MNGSKINILVNFIVRNWHSCPFEDDCGIDFDTKCVGFGKEGCKECIIENIELLN